MSRGGWMVDESAEDSGALPASLATRKMSLYRMYTSESLRDLVAPKVADKPGEYVVYEVRIASLPALLVAAQSAEAPVEWTQSISSLTGIDLGFTKRAASAALLIRIDTTVYALTFGQGWRLVREGKVDREFGLDIAVRLLDPEQIRRVTRSALSAKSRVDQNMVPGGQGLWAFGLREHAELVRKLAGHMGATFTVDLSHVRLRGGRRNFRMTLDCGDGLRLPLSTSGESLVADLRELSRVISERAVQSELAPLRWVRRLAQGNELRDVLDAEIADVLAGSSVTKGDVGIAYPARYYDGPDVQRYRGQIGQVDINTDELTLDDLRSALSSHAREDYLQLLRGSNIEGLDDEGQSIGGNVSALHWMAGEIISPQYRHVLMDGDWYELGGEYLSYVEHVVSQAFENSPTWTLPAWRSAPRNKDDRWVEGLYNKYVADTDPRFLCLDTKLVTSRVHPRGFEACDLLGPTNELVHVKKFDSKTGSSVLSHLFAQGLVAVESLTDPATWKAFREVVRKQDSVRADELGDRPAGLVYAIHRSDKPLDPRTLFTFARSALVSASVALSAYSVPLRIAVIP